MNKTQKPYENLLTKRIQEPFWIWSEHVQLWCNRHPTGWRLVDDSCQKLEKACGSSKKKKKRRNGAFSLPTSELHLLVIYYAPLGECFIISFPVYQKLYAFIFLCPHHSLTNPPATTQPSPKSSNWLRKCPCISHWTHFTFPQQRFCHNQTPHIKARTYFLRWGWDSSFVTWSYTHQPVASAEDWSRFLALSSERLYHLHTMTRWSCIHRKRRWFRVSADFTASAREVETFIRWLSRESGVVQ